MHLLADCYILGRRAMQNPLMNPGDLVSVVKQRFLAACGGCLRLEGCSIRYQHPRLSIQFEDVRLFQLALQDSEMTALSKAAVGLGALILEMELRCDRLPVGGKQIFDPARWLSSSNANKKQRGLIVSTKSIPKNNDSRISLDSGYIEVQEFLIDQYKAGKIVNITGMMDDRCYHVNDLLTTERAILPPAHFSAGFSYRHLWRETLDDYNRLITGLNQDGYIQEFEHRMLRVDGSLCEYSKDYFLVRNYLGMPVRISVADPAAWAVVRAAQAP